MLTRNITQTLDWIDNNPDSNPVINDTTTIVTRFLGIPLFTKTLTVKHTGQYKLEGEPSVKDKASVVKGFSQ